MIGAMFAGLLLALVLMLGGMASAQAQEAADTPNPWFDLQRYDGTMTQAEFDAAADLFDPTDALAPLTHSDDEALILYPSRTERQVPQFRLAFAPPGTPLKPCPRDYRTPADFRALPKPATRPLEGLRIALDPGHIGGEWGQVEDRSIYYEGIGRLQEGDLNLITAAILTKELTTLGAEVFPTRTDATPVTPLRPEQLRDEALATLLLMKPAWNDIPAARRPEVLRSHIDLMTHLLFERKYEFLARAEKIRAGFNPDLTVVLYINATPSSGRGHLIGDNQNIFFVEGAYTAAEVGDEDERQRLFAKILDRVAPVEYEVANHISQAFLRRTGLPPVGYGNSPTTRLVDPDNPYVVARNLGANRQYDGPVVTTEPYFMNNRLTAQRLVAGDYEGERIFQGKPYRSIFREYADCVLEGILATYGPSAAAATARPPEAAKPNG